MSLIDKLRYAFATEKDGKFSDEEIALVDKVAQAIVKRQMATPAIMFLESCRPLNFIGSQAMEFIKPIIGIAWSTKEFEQIAQILERRKSVDLIIERIEKMAHELRSG